MTILGSVIMRVSCYSLIILQLSVIFVTAADPIVTLKHGGQYEGTSTTFNGTTLDLFLGVRYAKPPVGIWRYEKPILPPVWTGVESAKSPGSICSQLTETGEQVGEEDCLFMDITIPGGLDPKARKPVMIWIHGGSYVTGSGLGYLGAPIAVYGDVIVVTINYRLGIMGFLSNGNGTGNYGLWDQRAAILYVKEHIEVFGGDPNMITIFGESAGGGSVSAQMMGQNNKGLFQRAIHESGPLYTDWGWFLSERQSAGIISFLQSKAGCRSNSSVYDCLRSKTLAEIEGYRIEYSVGKYPFYNPWHPTPDNSFFNENITKEDYKFVNNVDLLAGFNSEEGGLYLTGSILAIEAQTHKTVTGFTVEMAKFVLEPYCQTYTPMSAGLCLAFIMDTYNITTAPNDQERGVRIAHAFGELTFNADIIRQIRAHSKTPNTTYAYYFTDLYHSPDQYKWWPMPDWAKKGADHTDEIAFVWGTVVAKNEYSKLAKAYGVDGVNTGDSMEYLYEHRPDYFRPLSQAMMIMWTNFAKSGNPNKPTPTPAEIPTWSEFNLSSEKFMELNTKGCKLVTTPFKTRIDSLYPTIFKARSEQIPTDKAPGNE